MSIVSFDDGNDTKEYCNDTKYCGGLLIPLKNGDKGCSLCERIYSSNSTVLHRKRLIPDDNDGDPIFVAMTNYNANKPKIPTPGDIEDAAFVKQGRGRSIIDYHETHYE